MNKDRINFIWFLIAGLAVATIAFLHPFTIIQCVSFVLLAGFFFYLAYESFQYDRSGSKGAEPTGINIPPYVSKLIRSAAFAIPSLFLLYLFSYMGLQLGFAPHPQTNSLAMGFTNIERSIFGNPGYFTYSTKLQRKVFKDAVRLEKAGKYNEAIENLKFLNDYSIATMRGPYRRAISAIGGLYDKLGQYDQADAYYAKIECKKNGFFCNDPTNHKEHHYLITANRLHRLLKAQTAETMERSSSASKQMLDWLNSRSAIENGMDLIPITCTDTLIAPDPAN